MTSRETLPDHLSVAYVMAPDENGPCKIGVTSNLELRLKTLQIGCWMPLSVYGVRIAFRRDTDFTSLAKSAEAGAYRIEGMCHKNLKECGAHLHGEWFDVTAQEALKAITVSADKKGIAALSVEDVLGIDVPKTDGLMVRAHHEICKSLIAANEFVKECLDRHANNG